MPRSSARYDRRVDEWLGSACDRIAAATGLEPATLDLTDADTVALLELARAAAHESGDRRNAPLVCFLAGLALGRNADVELEVLARQAAGSND